MDEAASSVIQTDGIALLRILNGDINPVEDWSDGLMRAGKSRDALARIIPACIGPGDL